MKHRILFAICLMALAVSCAKTFDESKNTTQIQMKEVTLNVTSDPSKVTLQKDLSAHWDQGDSISVLVAGQNCKFVASESGASVDFTGSIPAQAEIESALVVYPYSASITVANDTLATVTFPHRQKVSKICNMMAGKVLSKGDGTLTVGMYNVGGLVEFAITRNDITSVTILDNNDRKSWMSGQATLYLNSDTGLPVIKTTGKNYQYSSVVALPDAETFAPGTYYVAVPAKTYSKGITVRMQNTDKKYASKSGSGDFEVVRSHIKPVSAIDTDVTFAVEVHTSILDFNASTYSKCGTCVWPFTEDEITSTTRTNWLGKDTTLTTKAEGYQYQLFASTYVQNTNSNCQGFKIGNTSSTTADYLQFPVIAGFGLTKAVVQIGNYNGSNIVDLYVVKNQKDTLYTEKGLQTAGKVLTFDFEDPKDGDTYRICHNATKAMTFRAIDCYYKTVSAGAQTVSSVTTGAATDTLTTAGTTATVSASFECQNFTAECACGIEYKAYDADSWTSQSPASAAKSFSVNLAGLTPNTLYNVRAWAKGKDDVAKVYGEEKSFVTRGPDFVMTLAFGTADTTVPDNYTFWTGESGWALPTSATTTLADKYYPVNGVPYLFTLQSARGYKYRTAGSGKSKVYHGLDLAVGTDDDTYGYIQLPAISGLKLKSVSLDGSAFKAATIYLSETVDGTTLAPTSEVGSYTEPSKTAYPTSAAVDIKGTIKANTRYYLVAKAKDVTLVKLVLTYTKAN